jgi:hypothetical protein
MTGRPYQKLLKKANSQKLKLPDFLVDSFVPERNLRDKGHLGAEIQNTLFPYPAYCLPPPPASYLYPQTCFLSTAAPHNGSTINDYLEHRDPTR